MLLTPYATIFRYPSDAADPNASEFLNALKAAEEICEYVFSVLPDVMSDY